MEYRRFGNKIVARIDKGEEICAKLLELAEAEDIRLAGVYGLGASDDVTLGVFDTATKVYNKERYAGTAYASGFVLAGHNYSRHFGRLDRLCAGDAVTFTDVEGNAFPYRVAEVQILRPTDTEAMLSPEWDLTLFTCTPGGRTRLAVRCVRDAP